MTILSTAFFCASCDESSKETEKNTTVSDKTKASSSKKTPERKAERMSNAALESTAKYQIYYKPDLYYVGDIMPMFDEGVFNIYYLDDERSAPHKQPGSGFHSFARVTTTDLTQYEGYTEAVVHGGAGERDLALGTGCVFRKGDRYYAFYTGWNGDLMNEGKEREVIMRAISDDGMKTFKKDPSFQLRPNDGVNPPVYEKDDWRDPQIVYDEVKDEYWMLFGGRRDQTGSVIRYKSKDLDHWTYAGDLYLPYRYNMTECPDLFKMGEYWYLVFSSFTNRGVTHYVYSKSMEGPWTVPEEDQFDDTGFYAGKTASDGKNRYIFGWVGTRKDCSYDNWWDWAGNLMVHKIVQKPDGTLGCALPDTIARLYNKNKPLVAGNAFGFGSWSNADQVIKVGGSGKSDNMALVGEMSFTFRLSADMVFDEGTDQFGLVFGADENGKNGLNYRFVPGEGIVRFDNQEGNDYKSKDPFSFRYIPLEAGKTYKLDFVIEGSVAVLYIDGQTTITARMYGATQDYWGFFCGKGQATFTNVNVYKRK